MNITRHHNNSVLHREIKNNFELIIIYMDEDEPYYHVVVKDHQNNIIKEHKEFTYTRLGIMLSNETLYSLICMGESLYEEMKKESEEVNG